MQVKSILAAAAALAMMSSTASAYEVTCGAPRVTHNEDRSPDTNPVVSVDVRYEPQDHSWRVFHRLADGRVVSRSEQYAITDASTDNLAQWQGSLNRQRNLYMVGEVRRDRNNVINYHEWMYDRNRNTMVMQSVAACRPVVAALAQPGVMAQSQPNIVIERRPEPSYRQQTASVLYFQVARELSVRSGPGSNHNLLGAIPSGVEVTATTCVERDDGIPGADWCLVSFRGLTGWGSRANLMPR
jgi:Bacterial SH3 domain